MNLFKLKFREIDKLSLFLCLVWGRDLLGYANAIFLRLPLLKEIGDYGREIILVIALLYCFRSFSKFITSGGVISYILFLVYYLLTYLFFPRNSSFLDDNIGPFFLATLPFLFVGRAINIEKLSKPFYFISLFYILWRFFIIIVLKRSEREMGEFSDYNMSAAYTFLPHLMMVTWHLLEKINVIDIVACLIGAVLLFGFGTRGPIFCMIIFVGLYFLFARTYKKKWISILFIILAVSLSIVYVNYVFDTLSSTTGSLGLSNRIINQYEEGMLNSDSGRGLIQDKVLDATRQSGFFGLGICGDRAATGENYSHNLFVEILSSFGYALGSLLIIALVLLLFIAWRSCKTQDQKGFYLVLLSFNIHLLLSSSFLQTPLFFLMIGYCIRLINDKKNKTQIYEKGNKNGRFAYVP